MTDAAQVTIDTNLLAMERGALERMALDLCSPDDFYELLDNVDCMPTDDLIALIEKTKAEIGDDA